MLELRGCLFGMEVTRSNVGQRCFESWMMRKEMAALRACAVCLRVCVKVATLSISWKQAQ